MTVFSGGRGLPPTAAPVVPRLLRRRCPSVPGRPDGKIGGMTAEMNGGDRSWDPIYGSGSRWGPAGASFDRLRDCVRLIRDEEFSDEVAVEMIREAAGSHRARLHSFVEGFINRDWSGDPLLTHVADLVRAVERNTIAPPLDAAVAEVVRDERRLLKLNPAAVFAELAPREPGLRDWARRASDPQWRAAQNRDVSSDVWESQSASSVGRWLIRRMDKWAERGRSRREADPHWAEFQRSVEVAKSQRGSMYVLSQELERLVGPHADSSDPLVRTYVALQLVTPYTWELTGIPRPTRPRR